jgi:hypothetical protein
LEEEDELFEERVSRLTNILADQFAEADKLEYGIRQNLKRIGYEL